MAINFEYFRFLLLVLPLLNAGSALGRDRPNVVLIISDDQAWTDYGFMGHPFIDTPNLDQLAAESLTYTRGYVASPLCRPSLASILTGLPPHVHGTTGNDPAVGDESIRNMRSRSYPRHRAVHQSMYRRLRKLPNVVRALHESGYATLQTGKWWEGDPQRFGFTDAMTHGDPDRGARHGDEGLSISRKGIGPIRDFLDKLDRGDDGSPDPFFIWHAPFLPHAPHNPPSDLLARYQDIAPAEPVARYWAMCEWFDRTCGKLLDELHERGLQENTVVLYITDNGWIQDPAQANKFAPRSKTTPYEGGIRTPVMVRWPGRIDPELDTATLVSAIDIAPTILKIAGVDVPETFAGIDLRDKAALARRSQVFGSDHPHDIPDVHAPAAGVESRYIVQGPWKLIFHQGTDSDKTTELFHLGADPHERVNLAQARPGIVAELMASLDDWWSP